MVNIDADQPVKFLEISHAREILAPINLAFVHDILETDLGTSLQKI